MCVARHAKDRLERQSSSPQAGQAVIWLSTVSGDNVGLARLGTAAPPAGISGGRGLDRLRRRRP